jgi:hypothetical protein
MTILLPNKVTAANAGWTSQFRIRGQRHRPGMAEFGVRRQDYMDDPSFIPVQERRRLLYYAWGIAAFATVLVEIPLLICFPMFPFGLTKMLGLREGGIADTVGGIVGWVVYLIVTITLLRTQKRQRYFMIYGILCLILALNVVGCHRMLGGLQNH